MAVDTHLVVVRIRLEVVGIHLVASYLVIGIRLVASYLVVGIHLVASYLVEHILEVGIALVVEPLHE